LAVNAFWKNLRMIPCREFVDHIKISDLL